MKQFPNFEHVLVDTVITGSRARVSKKKRIGG